MRYFWCCVFPAESCRGDRLEMVVAWLSACSLTGECCANEPLGKILVGALGKTEVVKLVQKCYKDTHSHALIFLVWGTQYSSKLTWFAYRPLPPPADKSLKAKFDPQDTDSNTVRCMQRQRGGGRPGASKYHDTAMATIFVVYRIQ